MISKKYKDSSKVNLVMSVFDSKNPNIKKLLKELENCEITIFCYDAINKLDYPIFFINYIINVNENIIACDKMAAEKCDKYKKKYELIDISAPIKMELSNV